MYKVPRWFESCGEKLFIGRVFSVNVIQARDAKAFPKEAVPATHVTTSHGSDTTDGGSPMDERGYCYSFDTADLADEYAKHSDSRKHPMRFFFARIHNTTAARRQNALPTDDCGRWTAGSWFVECATTTTQRQLP